MARLILHLTMVCTLLMAAGCNSRPAALENEPPLILGQRFATAAEAQETALAALLETLEVADRVGPSPLVTRGIATGSMAQSRPLSGATTRTEIETLRLDGAGESLLIELTVRGQGRRNLEWALLDWQVIDLPPPGIE